MSNLIITIISIAIVGIAAAMGIYYGGVAYENAQINATANAIMNEAQQILNAERLWSTNNNQPDISGMGTAGASGTGMSMLVSSKVLSTWPSFAGTIGVSGYLSNPGPQPYIGSSQTAGNITTGTFDWGCYNIGGYAGKLVRSIFSYNNENFVTYDFYQNNPYTGPCQTNNGNFSSSTTDISQANHPIVKITKAINAAMNQIPANANLATMPYIGLPYYPSGSTQGNVPAIYDPSAWVSNKIMFDPSGTLQTNYCYLYSGYIIVCVFGPS